MKLTYFQLKPHLAKKLAPLYIISGEELLQKQDALDLIRHAAKQAGIQERVRLTLDTGLDVSELYTQLFSGSLMADKRLIELDCRNVSINKAVGEVLQQYADNPSADNVLIIDIGKIDDKIAKASWYRAFEKIGMVIAVWPIPRDQLPAWLVARAKNYQLQLDPGAANLLADYVEGNLMAAAQALEKLYLLQPRQPVGMKAIQAVLADESQFTVFDLVEVLVSGKTQRALHILEQLEADGTEPTLILWGITRELRLLAELSNEVKQGAAFEDLFQKHRIFAKRQASMRAILKKITASDCWRHLTHAADIDCMIKGASKGNVWDNLRMFCLRLA